MKYPHVVTFEEPTKTQLPSGQEEPTYAAVSGLTDLPARVVPMEQEDQETRMVIERDLFTIVVQGDREIDREMRAVTTFLSGVLNVIKVQRPVLYRSAHTYATLVTAERVTAGVEAGS